MADTMTLDELKEAVADICAGCDTQRSLFTNAQLADAIDAAIKQRERDKRDATRYRWLRKQHNSSIPSWHVRSSTGSIPLDLDIGLDAEMEKESGMADLDTLRPEVQAAMRELREALRVQGVGSHGPQFTIIRAELLQRALLEKQLRDAYAKQHEALQGWVQRATDAEAELVALKARIAKSHEVTVCRHPAGAVTMFVPEGMNGKRVRLLVEE